MTNVDQPSGESPHSSISHLRHTEKMVSTGEHVPVSTTGTKRSPFLDSIQKSLESAALMDDQRALSAKLKPSASKGTEQEPVSFESITGKAMPKKKKETIGKDTQNPLTKSPGSSQSLVAIILAILDEIMTSQSKTQEKSTMAAATLATQQATIGNEAAMSQYASDMTSAGIERNQAWVNIGSGIFNIATGGIQAACGFAEFGAATNAAKEGGLGAVDEAEAEIGGSMKPLEQEPPENVEESEGGAGTAGTDEEAAPEAPVNQKEAEQVREQDTTDSAKAKQESEAQKRKAARKLAAAQHRKSAEMYRAKVERYKGWSSVASLLSQGGQALQNGLTGLENAHLKENQAEQTAQASLLRALGGLVQASQQATEDISKKSGSITESIIEAIRQAFRSVVDASSMRG